MPVWCRRSADVRSVGYSELIVLSRDDVLTALKDHPDAEVSNNYTQRTCSYTQPLHLHSATIDG